MMRYEYGAYVTVLGIVIGVGAKQILIKGIWEGESPIKVDEQGINAAVLELEGAHPKVVPGDFVRATVQVVEKRIPRSGADLDSPMVPGGEVGFRLVRLEKLTMDQLVEELTKISRYVYSIHFKPVGSPSVERKEVGGEEVLGGGVDEDLVDWSWVRGHSSSR